MSNSEWFFFNFILHVGKMPCPVLFYGTVLSFITFSGSEPSGHLLPAT
jgi:hypothetical protein